MVDVHNNVVDTVIAQAQQCDLQQSLPGDFNQSLRTAIGDRLQAGSEARRKHHRLHWRAFSNTTCSTTTSTPFLPRRYLANCSAKYTERCRPPVQPKDTIKSL